MNTFQSCRNTTDAVPLYLPQNLYLKPIARIFISVQLPQKIEPGKSISNWEIMEKLRVLVRPEEFSILKVSKNTLEFIRFEAEIEDKSKLYKVIALLDARSIKINAFHQNIKVRASEAKLEFPNRHAWDSFFRDAKNMDEMKPGERPDTMHISNLPIKWFVPFQHMHKEDLKPSQKIFHRVFEKFGNIRYVDIPICDPYRSKMKEHMTGMKTFTFDQDTFFEGYVQFKDYVGFSRGMDAFRGMKLLYKESATAAQTVNVKVDFDKTKHLSDASLRRRQIVRERLIAKDRDKEEKEKQEKVLIDKVEEEKRRRELEEKEAKERRRREREERRKARHFAQLKLSETDELQKKIVKEEKKLIKAQRNLEAIRLIEALFARIKVKREKFEADINKNNNSLDELTKYKKSSERKFKDQREKLKKAREGHIVLSSILGKNSSTDSSSDSDSDSKKKHKKKKHKKKKKKEKNEEKPTSSVIPDHGNPYLNQNWYIPSGEIYQFPQMFGPPMRGMPPGYFPPMMRGRGLNVNPGTSRGSYPRRRGAYNPYWNRGWRGRRGSSLPSFTPEMEHQYYKYFSKFLEDGHDDRSNRSYSRSRSRSRSSSSHRRRSRKNSYSSRSRRRSRSSSRSYSRSRSRHKSRSRSRSRKRSRSRRNRSRSRSRSKSKSRRKSRSKSKSRSRSRKRSTSTKRSKEKSRSPSYRSIDSSKFISPSRLRSRRSRSKSWSLPRSIDKKKRSSWSKSPSNSKK